MHGGGDGGASGGEKRSVCVRWKARNGCVYNARGVIKHALTDKLNCPRRTQSIYSAESALLSVQRVQYCGTAPVATESTEKLAERELPTLARRIV